MRVYCLFAIATVAFPILCVLVCGASVRDDSTLRYMIVRDNTCGPSLTWSLSGGTLTITGTGEMNNYTSSSAVPWYKQRSDITKIVINEGVTSITDYAFINCKKVTTATIPSTITSIGIKSFQFCDVLSTVTIPAAVTSIGEDAFLGCKRLTSVNVEQGNTMYVSINGVLFNHNKTTLIHYPAGRTAPTYDVPAGVTLIERAAFYLNGVLTSITIPASVESIGELALYICSSLTSISVDENNVNFKSIDGVLFSHDLSVLVKYPIGLKNTTYTIPDGVKVIGRDAFESARLVHLTIPDSVQTIEVESFYGLSALESVTIPNSVTSIGNLAFSSCSKLSSVTISGPLNSTGKSIFESCTSLTEVIISEGVKSIGNYFFRDCTQLKAITIPSSLESIGEYAFYSCTGLTKVFISDGVKSIGEHAFCGCAQLENVVIPASVNSIGNAAFRSCTSLTKVNISDGVKSIGNYSFDGCNSLKSITIPGSVESIGVMAFQSCTSLTDVIILDGVKSIKRYAFSGCTKLENVIIPGSVESIGSIFSSCTSLAKVIISDGVKSIEDYSFSGCNMLKSITIPGSVKSIGKYAFRSCISLTDVIITDGVKSIGDYAFHNCTQLETVTIPGSVELIGGVFSSCTSLTKVNISDGVKSIGGHCFDGCNKLKSITIPESVESIGDYSFQHCTSLTDVIISDGVKSIGYRTFSDCISLVSVTIPESVDSIDLSAFNNCSNLASVFYQGSSVITSSAFSKCDSLNTVCVSPDYKKSSFCGKAVTSSDPLCQEFRGLFSHCFVAAYVDGGFIQQQRKNVSIWENQTNLCTVYYCDNATGPQSSALVTCDDPPPCYKIQGHCNVSNGECEYDRVDEWNELMEQENHCYGLVCEENTTKMKERDNATAWNKHSNNCYVYECENESGLRIAGSCSELGLICVNEECLEKTEMNEERWIVEVELDGVPAIDMEVSELEKNVMITSGLNGDEFKIGYEVDEDGYVIRISIYVRDEKTANDIASAINGIEKGSCTYGVICKKTRVHVREINNGTIISQSPRMFVEMILVMMICSLSLMTVDI